MNLAQFLYPQVCTLKSRARKNFNLRGEGGRDLIFLVFFVLLEYATYAGTSWMLKTINQNPELIFLQPAQPLSLFLACLLAMTFFAALAAAYDFFYQAYDLDLLFASPVNTFNFFGGRFLSVLISVSWMPFLLLAPVLLAFGRAYGGGPAYYAGALLIFIPFFIIPSASAVIIATLFARFIPRRYSREFLIAIAIGFIAIIYKLVTLLGALLDSGGDEKSMLLILSLISKGEVLWLPSYWTAKAIESFLILDSFDGTVFLALSTLCSIALLSLGYAFFEHFRVTAFDKTRSRSAPASSAITKVLRLLSDALPIRTQARKALYRKEALLFSREITQIIQLGVMISLVILYLLNLGTFLAAIDMPGEIGLWYQRFTFIGNFSVGAFIAIAACTRLVFPSLSLEGRSFWILQTAPVEYEAILKTKLWYWIGPISILVLSLFTVSAFAIGMSPLVATCYGICSLAIAYGAVGSACGLGAVYARFDWESPSQLCAGFGSLMYMLYSSALITLTMIPTWFLLFRSSGTILSGQATEGDILRLVINSAIVLLINYCGAQYALRSGRKTLERMRESIG